VARLLVTHMLWSLVVCWLAVIAGEPARAERPLQHHLGITMESVPAGITERELQELVSIVFQEGHRVDFGMLCIALNIQYLFDGCTFRQVSVGLATGNMDTLSFNVPDDGERGVALVVLCHTAQDVNEIFVVSMAAALRRAFVSGPDGRYVEADVHSVEAKFLIDTAYWAKNLARVYEDLGLEKPSHRR
jgi:hypothetical protein